MIPEELQTDSAKEQAKCDAELAVTLAVAEQALLAEVPSTDRESDQAQSWMKARTIVEDLKLVPWFIWRVANYSISGRREIPEGMVIGLKRLILAAASDHTLNISRDAVNKKSLSLGSAIKSIGSDVTAAVCVIHALCRKLGGRPFERMWRPVLDDSLIRAKIGFAVGSHEPAFGRGRGMLAGFATRFGEALLLTLGNEKEANQFLELCATGTPVSDAGYKIYGVSPIHLGMLCLSASGAGTEPARAAVLWIDQRHFDQIGELNLPYWVAAFELIEKARLGKLAEVPEDYAFELALDTDERMAELAEASKQNIRRGHGWQWIAQGNKA